MCQGKTDQPSDEDEQPEDKPVTDGKDQIRLG